MKTICKELLMAAVIAWVVPWFLVSAVLSAVPQRVSQEMPEETTGVAQKNTEEERIPVLMGDTKTTLSVQEYLVGVLLAEMPGSFLPEAKMAQAVVARTYALRTVAVSDKHPGYVCTDSTCCQGYLSPEKYLTSGGKEETVAQAVQAVTETEGLVLTYNGNLIDATYFSCSGGKTEAAVAVWGTDIPYLQSVESPGEESAEHYTDTVVFTHEGFCSALGRTLQGNPSSWFGTVTYTEGGGVSAIFIGQKRYTGTEIRALLGLRSTVFSISVTGSQICITTRGYGHRVGMSQYGAQNMASEGKNFRQILSHYYTGACVANWP